MYLRNNANGTYLPLVTEANVSPGTHFNSQVHFITATPDLSHVVVESKVALLGAGSAVGLYEWSAGKLQLVSRMPGGKAAPGTAELGFQNRAVTHAISADGSRVVWTIPESAVEAKRGHLYMRDTARGETIQLDAAQGVAEPQTGSAQFQSAGSDGSRVFFTDKQRLTTYSTAEPGQGTGKPDLYVCEIGEVVGKLTCDLRDLTVDPNENESAAVRNLIFGANEDGTTVYLIAQGVLADNENGNGETAESNMNNLYEIHLDGSQWVTTFVARLSAEDGPEWEGDKLADTAYLTARVSPNGRYLAFMSAASLTGYDNVDANSEAKGARDEEVYLYDAETGSLRCVSCNPTGARPSGVLDTQEAGEGLGLLVDRPRVWLGHRLAGNIPGWTTQSLTSALFQSRYLSDGGRLYFNSPDSLVPAAKNAKEDVYQYEPSGIGSCQSSSGGCVALISGGGSDRESAFVEATPDGSSVFFTTQSKLLPQDTDTAFDIYDARECTGVSPCLTPPEPLPPPCGETETCRPAEPAQTIPGGPAGTATFSGPGNIVSHVPSAKEAVEAKKAARPPTRAQKLSRALKSCRRRYSRSKRKRRVCEHSARKRYGNTRKTKTTKSKPRVGR